MKVLNFFAHNIAKNVLSITVHSSTAVVKRTWYSSRKNILGIHLQVKYEVLIALLEGPPVEKTLELDNGRITLLSFSVISPSPSQSCVSCSVFSLELYYRS